MADRIQARAIRRCGELLREIPAGTGGRPPKTHTATDTSFEFEIEVDVIPTRTSAANGAGLSKRQKDTALQVANVPAPESRQ